MRKEYFIAAIFLISAISYATPTVSNVSITDVSQTSFLVKYDISPSTSYCQVKVGLASGVYNRGASWTLYTDAGWAGHCWMPINGLSEGTTYYVRPTARPDPDDDTNICATNGCGAVELSTVTTTGPIPHLPTAPIPIATWVSSYPDTTSNYVTIPLVDGGTSAAHECVAATTTSSPPGYSYTVTAGTTLENIINTVGFGTIIEVPEGTTCVIKTNANGSIHNHGYRFHDLAADPLSSGIDDPVHRWIILRTHANQASDLPPFGYRAGPQFNANYGVFKATSPLNDYSVCVGLGNCVNPVGGGAQFFAGPSDNTGMFHHLWISNLKFVVDETHSSYGYDTYLQFGTLAATPTPNLPAYIVFDRNWFHAPARASATDLDPSASNAYFGAVDRQFSIVGNYFDNWTWGSSGAVPIVVYLNNGMGGPHLYENNYCDKMAMCWEQETLNPYAAPPVWPHDATVHMNSFYWPTDQIAFAIYVKSATGGAYGCRQNIETKGTDRLSIVGNTINGNWSCGNSGAPIALAEEFRDVTVRSNLAHKVATGMIINGEGNGVSAQGIEFPSTRVLVDNNLMYDIGRGSWDASGPGLDSAYFEIGSVANDLVIRNNTFGPMAQTSYWVTPILSYTTYGAGQTANLNFVDNIYHFSTGSTTSQAGVLNSYGLSGPAGIYSHPVAPIPKDSTGQSTSALNLDFAKIDGTSGLGLGGVIVNQGGTGYSAGSVSFTGCSSTPTATYTVSGGAVTGVNFSSFGSGCDPTLITATVSGGSGASLTPIYGGNPAYTWASNIDICAYQQSSDMANATCQSLASTMPTTDTLVTGSSTLVRQTNGGLLGINKNDLRCTPSAQNACGGGVNYSRLEAELGIVSNIAVSISSASAALNYTAPDVRSCAVDISSNSGVTWSRQNDTGGLRNRTVTFNGLASSTNYQYRLLCYYPQDPTLSPWFEFPSDASNLNTSGTFTTLGSSAISSLSFPFSLSDFPGATSFRVDMTSINGVLSSTTCTISPCVVNAPIGDYTMKRNWIKSGAVIGSSDIQIMRVR